ncbi:uncharacterized protein LOC129240455 isoform X1 [Anastrepha obliqua]|uniref:uncharacterized protein LOC129240455 isoform X1 n=1 Tax=Anastrepha obliqua TaxID=95512 RepID=UPI00240A1CF5|nr:uncharacterized protein LOC129240455 isoform X1 [Anastrepha obliqua]XP_054732224.1 uncharacterized protein LOC129240455 isoform X1 [Anastrepha obliqua]XP_054732226.1 uncharacterized protein LOC129240455 isoform X1 [Anastrepha obliqua]XP_054732227.1 uncharacterized protein LOC129240455 isoform X1 [Anastrepha obliqua]XP_054732228.1 uncharacterized protein LOC129240455 isoform X1 [Anastrepha obliqua]XP_054732229.1 uncharacterized protein LOC129240455 isoform X1 [Anastrepha obliqua]XP_05473223
MDSLKIPKGGNSNAAVGGGKPTGSVPITVRFNAGDECIDDIFQTFHNSNNSGCGSGVSGGAGGNGSGGGGGGVSGSGGGGGPNVGGGNSLSTSPSQHHQLQQQNMEDVNTRNNFLQGNFFNRKRSGSIEGVSPTSSGDNLISTLSGDTASVGTWRLIKGKVSQTFEDIKSSKTSSQALSTSVPKVESPRQHFQQLLNDPESDPDNPTTHSSISDDLLFDLERKSPHLKGGDSDSSADGEQLPESEAEHSRLRRGLANLKSKVKSKPHHHSQSHQSSSHSAQQTGLATAALSSATISTAFGTAAIKPMKRESTGSNSSSKGSLRDAFLRRRRPSPTDQTDRTVLVPRLEPNEAQPTDKKASAKIKKRGIISGKKEVEIESGVEMMEDTLPTLPDDSNRIDEPGTSMGHRNDLHLHFKSDEEWFKIGPSQSTYNEAAEVGDHQQQEINTQRRDEQILPRENERECKNIQAKTKFATSMPISRVAVLLIVLLLPVHGFIRGVLACLMSFAIADSLSIIAQAFIYKFFQSHPEQSEFEIPDYTKLPICKVPAVEEHKTVKSYTGWMNEIFSYDPVTFHITQTNSVYLRLDGTILRVSTTLARIPKRVMWNEQPIDIKHIHFTGHRIFNLLGCNVELLPLGLARKRYFNRKYPIQLIIKRSAEDDTYLDLSEQPSNEHSATGSRTEVHSTDSRLSQISNEVLEQYTDLKETNANSQDVDFASAIMNADLQQLQDDTQNNDTLIPCGDEVRLILFARADREKEDWYRRFVAASEGDVHDQVLRLPNLKLVDDAELQRAAAKAAQMPLDPNAKRDVGSSENDNNADNESLVLPPDMAPPLVVESKSEFKDIPDDMEVVLTPTETFEGLLMSSCAARNPQDYIRFMAIYQGACKEDRIPVYATPIPRDKHDKSRRSRRNANELWKGIDQSLFLGPSGSVVWANVLIGRVLYSCLHDSMVKDKIKELLQKKISAIKLPSFIEDIIITKINLGDTPPLIHRVSQPFLDERGTWVDADITYEGLLQLTVTTKLNLMRIKQQKRPTDGINITVPNPMHTVTNTSAPNGTSSTGVTNTTAIPPINVISDAEAGRIPTTRLPLDELNADDVATSVIFDSDAESTGDSDTDPESVSAPMASTLSNVGLTSSASGIAPQSDTATGAQSDYNFIPTAPGNARRIFRIVDRIAASNFFQYATDLPVVQRAIENMNTNITLRIDLRGLVGRGVINIPPPPSDRIWLSFRGPPRLWLSAKPALGEKSVDYSIVTSIIESKLCEVVNKFLVYPNMVDVTIPFLGQPTYEYLRGEKTKRTE